MRDKTRNRDRTNMKGLRRPHFEVQMSDQWPITGTVNSAINGAVSEIRRLLKGNAIKINDKLVQDEKLIIDDKLFNQNYLKNKFNEKWN